MRSRLKFFVLLGPFAVVTVGCVAFTSPGRAQTITGGGALQTGQALFEKRCGGCHALDREKEGPRLRGVYGRPAGSLASFQYSEAVKNSRITWNADTLDRWLTDTEKVIPANDMAFHVDKPDERREIIAFLRQNSEKQVR